MRNQVLYGSAAEQLARIPSDSVQTVVTSPPYWGLRDYGHEAQLGDEETPQEFCKSLVGIFEEVRRVLKADGTVWLNLGDSYARDAKKGQHKPGDPGKQDYIYSRGGGKASTEVDLRKAGLKPKDLVGIPWRAALALQQAGWYLRTDIVWCLSGGTWLYARTSKREGPTMLKDLVRCRPEDVQLWNGASWVKVLGWGENPNPSSKLTLTLRSGERLHCTGSHLWPTQRGLVQAKDLLVGDVLDTCLLPDSGEDPPGFLTADILWFLGLYLAEGSRADRTIQLALNASEVEWLPRLRLVAAFLGGSLTYTLDANELAVRLYGGIVASVVDTYIGGNSSKTKHLKVATWRLPNDYLNHIARGYLAGDGHEEESRYRLGFCRNYALERDLRVLAARLGATLTLNPCQSQYQGGSKSAFRGEWRWSRSGHHNEKSRSEIVKIHQGTSRKFWDLSVEGEPHLFSLASGVLTHNCKPNAMPEPVEDRPTHAHEYVFLLSKSETYFYDFEALLEIGVNGKPRNRRSVWNINTEPYRGAHFAVMPSELAVLCIKAGSRPGDLVLDPFAGSGTTLATAVELQRDYLGIELNEKNRPLIEERIGKAEELRHGRDAFDAMLGISG